MQTSDRIYEDRLLVNKQEANANLIRVNESIKQTLRWRPSVLDLKRQVSHRALILRKCFH